MRAAAAFLVIVAGLAVWGWLTAVRERTPDAVEREGAAVPDRTGSLACAPCHSDVYARWKETTHARTTRPFGPESVARPFDGEVFVTRDLEHRLGPGAQMTCEGPGGGASAFPVDRVVGARRIQMFTTRLDGGRIQVLPVFVEVPERRWFDYADFVFGGPSDLEIPPDSPNSWYTYARNFNSRCGRCHLTNFETNYDPDAAAYDSAWTEPVIGCEACHGDGGAHVRKWRRLESGPDPILNAGRAGVTRSNEACAYCHAEAEEIFPGFRPGDDVLRYVDVFGLEDAQRLHPDGRAKELIHNYVPLLQSRCGPLACTLCHDPHGTGRPGDLKYALDDDRMCAQCHRDIATELTAHTHHKAEGTGSRCIACHMPRMIIEAGHGRVYDHTISTPSPRNTQRLGLPNACADCHATEDAGWERASFARWWPGAEEKNHRTALAETVGAGRAGQPAAEEPLLALLADDNPVYRAGAAWMLAAYDVDLRPQLADPHALVRRAAVKGVAARHPEALVPLLDDDNHVLRHAAALALAERYEFLRVRPELQARLLGVLESFAEAKPDQDRLHFAVGALHELAGRTEEAVRAYERYLRLRPWDERTRRHVDELTASS